MKKIRMKYIVYAFFALLLAVFVVFILLFQRNIRTAASVKKLEDGLYSMVYEGDYRFNDFLEQGGASDDLAVAEFVIQNVFHGLLPIDLRGGTFGCSTISAETPEGDAVFGRNFDWGTCTALIVQTSPAEGYDSVSTVNMDFLNLGLDMPEEMQMRLLSAAAPFAPMDGIRDALDSVSKHNFDSEFASTEWSIVYNQSTGEARYYHRENYQKYYTFITDSP